MFHSDFLEKLTRDACAAVQETAGFIRAEMGRVTPGQIEEKHLNGLVSYVDRHAEEMLAGRLARLLPDATFITEEGVTAQRSSALQWIIDPLDGTTNFLYGLPHFSVSVGLQQDEDFVLGIVYHVPLQQCFYAWKGGGAWQDGQRLHTARRGQMRQALIATGFPYHNFSRYDGWFAAMTAFMKEGRGLRRYGSAALDLAYVAAGYFDVFFEYGLNIWDVAGGIVLVREAGGMAGDFSGGGGANDGSELLAANALIYPAALQIIKDSFGKESLPMTNL